MSGRKEIRSKIASIKNTQKITRAMQMVAASKMRKTQDRFRKVQPYTDALVRTILKLGETSGDYRHPYFLPREGKNKGVLLVSSDKGLCGGLNANLFRHVLRQSRLWEEEGAKVSWGILGQKGASFFSSIGAAVVAQKTQLGDTPHADAIRGVFHSLLRMFERGEIDSLWIASNQFVNTMTQKPRLIKLLPIETAGFAEIGLTGGEKDKSPYNWDYIYEPGPAQVLDAMIKRYLDAVAYRSLVENGAAEQSARMVAMQSASDNAGRIMKELQLVYNKARQAAITQEIAEIVAGAAAV